MTVANLNALDQEAFVGLLGGVFEHSSWVAERAWPHRPFASLDSLLAAMRRTVDEASREEQLALIQAHPDLGTRARVSASSEQEQSGAGLDKLSPEEHSKLIRLNEAYKLKFGFPFLYAVKGSNKTMILAALQQRLASKPEDEFAEALRQIYRIAQFRLEAMFHPQDL